MVIGRLFGRRQERQREESRPSRPAYREGARMYCVGDIHGRADLLTLLHRKIRKDVEAYSGTRQVLYLGDYIDRGLQSREVIDLLIEQPLEGFEAIHLKGNHEQAMLDFMDHPESTASWLNFGGRETLASYGLQAPFMPLAKDLQRLAEDLKAALPGAHREFLENGLLSWRSGDYYFVHAGIRPGVDLEEQHFEDQLWIRDDFIGSDADHGVVVVHGHTIFPEPEIRPNRISIDTGAFHTDVLTCLVLEGEEQRLLQTGP